MPIEYASLLASPLYAAFAWPWVTMDPTPPALITSGSSASSSTGRSPSWKTPSLTRIGSDAPLEYVSAPQPLAASIIQHARMSELQLEAEGPPVVQQVDRLA